MNYIMLPIVVVLALLTASTVTAKPKDVVEIYPFEQVNNCSDNGAGFIKIIRTAWEEDLLFTSDVSTYTVNKQGVQKKIPGELMLLANQDTGTFTALMLYPWGTVCEVLSGKNFEPYVGE